MQFLVLNLSMLFVFTLPVRSYSPIGEVKSTNALTLQELASGNYQVLDMSDNASVWKIPDAYEVGKIDSIVSLGNTDTVNTLVLSDEITFLSDEALKGLSSLNQIEVPVGSANDFVKKLRVETLPSNNLYLVEDDSMLFVNEEQVVTKSTSGDYYVNVLEGDSLSMRWETSKVSKYEFDGKTWKSNSTSINTDNLNYTWTLEDNGIYRELSKSNKFTKDNIDLNSGGTLRLQSSNKEVDVRIHISVKAIEHIKDVGNVHTGFSFNTPKYGVAILLALVIGAAVCTQSRKQRIK